MTEGPSGLIELVVVFGIILALALYELFVLRIDRQRDDHKRDKDDRQQD
jgi:hypothetical protein